MSIMFEDSTTMSWMQKEKKIIQVIKHQCLLQGFDQQLKTTQQ
jgi:hypothetical protein